MFKCSTVTILVGLPGSGKTTYLEETYPPHKRSCCLDDFHKDSLDNTGEFTQSRHYETLRAMLRDGVDCLISDIEYCRTERLSDAEQNLRVLEQELRVGVKIVRKYFENNPGACRHNVVHRYSVKPNRDYLEELRNIDELSRAYNCPTEGVILIKTCCNTVPRLDGVDQME